MSGSKLTSGSFVASGCYLGIPFTFPIEENFSEVGSTNSSVDSKKAKKLLRQPIFRFDAVDLPEVDQIDADLITLPDFTSKAPQVAKVNPCPSSLSSPPLALGSNFLPRAYWIDSLEYGPMLKKRICSAAILPAGSSVDSLGYLKAPEMRLILGSSFASTDSRGITPFESSSSSVCFYDYDLEDAEVITDKSVHLPIKS